MDYDILNQTNSPEDVKKLSFEELETLSEQIRSFLVEHVSQTGGHLASNLGIVELTLAIHKVFNTELDRLVLDVGHQCYVHKLLTGRRADFKSLRKFGGMSGFLRPYESVHDACITGHASNSVSVALGMARARTILKEEYSVIAVIGDGALTGGLAYEALNDAGQSKEPLIVVLNDNEMSITKNVGAISKYLSRLRLRPRYLHFKDIYRRITKQIPGGTTLDNIIHKVKNSIKNIFIPASLFEDMGFTYLGPANGHDLKYVIYLLELARDLKRPVLIHLTTVKGKGYKFSEECPQNFHGVSKFDIDSGKPMKSKEESFSEVFGDEICNLAEENSRVCAITAAMQSGVGLSRFSVEYPKRFFDVGIAEGHAAAMAAGLAGQGMLPVCAVYSTFLQRAYDMLIHDISIAGLHVVFAVDRAGLVGEDGETHHGVFDIAYLSHIPGIVVFCPSSFIELRDMLRYSVLSLHCPAAIRYCRGGEGNYKDNAFQNRGNSVILRSGKDITIVGYGIIINEILAAADLAAEKDGISCEIIKLNVVTPLNITKIQESVLKTHSLLVVEDCINTGCVGERMTAHLFEKNIICKAILLNTGDGFTPNGEQRKLMASLGIDANGIYRNILEACKD